ncbi:DUF7472 family protein [Halovenus salina]|uniref:Uncharacterized protein n=1 Tax=Halovenus salina TaxID=1510225 RepID=A0ABD5VUZ3_9EURY|nr:hypothetical protein [Halovenus salina]
MELDRKTVVQIVVSVVAVALFITGLVVVTAAYGETETIGPDDEEGQLDGTLSGDFGDDFEIADDGTASGGFSGDYVNGVDMPVDGQVTGTVEDGVFTGTFEGSISVAIEGNTTGEMNGTIDDGSFNGTYVGTARGETRTTLSADGGLALIGLIVAYIVFLPLMGYVVENYDFEE